MKNDEVEYKSINRFCFDGFSMLTEELYLDDKSSSAKNVVGKIIFI